MKCDSVGSLFDGLIQESSNERLNEVTKNIRSSENNGNKSLPNIKGSMPTRDINQSLDERSDNSVMLPTRKPAKMVKTTKKESKRKYVL